MKKGRSKYTYAASDDVASFHVQNVRAPQPSSCWWSAAPPSVDHPIMLKISN
jgi:hypothetical protein